MSIDVVFGDLEIKGNSGSITLDRGTYPIPLDSKSTQVSVKISDRDFDISPNRIDKIAQDVFEEPGVGPVKVSVVRGDQIILGYAGGKSTNNGKLDSKPLASNPSEKSQIRQFGPIVETSPQSGIFEFTFEVQYTDGPESSKCPPSSLIKNRFDDADEFSRHCILEGDVLLVEYIDPTDAAGNQRVVTTSGVFTSINPSIPLGSGSEKITASKTVRIGHPLTLLLYDSNLNLDSYKAESYSLDLIQFESENIRITMGPLGGAQSEFNPQPSVLRETGDDTGIFYTVVEIPRTLKGKRIDVGEKIEFEYTQRGLGAFLVVRQSTYSPNLVDATNNSKFHQDSSQKSSETICKAGYVKILKYDNSPACVKPTTAEKLKERGWAKS